MNLFSHARPGQKRELEAFSLIEAMVGIGVVSIAFISLYIGITTGFGVVSLTRENLRATQIMQEKFETLRLYNWDQINSNGFIPANFTNTFYPAANGNQGHGVVYNGTMVIGNFPTTESYSTNMRLVTLTVVWTSGKVQRNRQLQTAVARYGLQNYVY